MDATRFLIVMADDYGIGAGDTLRGIRELAVRGVVTGTVVMVNSPYALDGVCAGDRWARRRNWAGILA